MLSVEVEADAESAARRAAEIIDEAAREALRHGSFSIALSGGRSPWTMLDLLGPDALTEPGVAILQVDERVAPDGDPDRNLTQMRDHLSAAAQERLRPMPVNDADLDAAADKYAGALPDPIDLVHLGLGPDGHTASLVPGDDVLEVTDRKVAPTAGEYQGRRRLTLTYPVLNAAKRVLFLVTGEDKRDALTRLRAGDPSIPAGRLEPRAGMIIADRAATGG